MTAAKKKEPKESQTTAEGKDFLERAGVSKRREIKKHSLPAKGATKPKKEKGKKEKEEKEEQEESKPKADTKAKKVKKSRTMKETASEAAELLAADPPGNTAKTHYQPFTGSYKD
eukprot:c432_g1_i1.p1 GENE.c432_g1_i1~~c432_g1_i1.p1  ORF type:complete len:115 (-),score=31.40 c432_g1_i1:59-403(-)